jgi:hypothetical protein
VFLEGQIVVRVRKVALAVENFHLHLQLLRSWLLPDLVAADEWLFVAVGISAAASFAVAVDSSAAPYFAVAPFVLLEGWAEYFLQRLQASFQMVQAQLGSVPL